MMSQGFRQSARKHVVLSSKCLPSRVGSKLLKGREALSVFWVRVWTRMKPHSNIVLAGACSWEGCPKDQSVT